MQVALCRRFDELKGLGKLPSPTGVALAILRLADSDQASVPELSRILGSDPALAGRVIKLANSVNGGSTRPVTSVRSAVVRLGIRSVRNIALGFSVISRSRVGGCAAFDYDRFWSRSVAMAVAAQLIDARLGHANSDEAYTFGLLAQVGALALANVYPQEYGAILTQCADVPPERLIELEQQQFATNHNELTAAMFADWRLSDVSVEAVRHHEIWDNERLPASTPANRLARILHLASYLAAVCVAEDPQRPGMMAELFARGKLLALKAEDLTALRNRLTVEWREWGEILDVETQLVPCLTELAERARRSEAKPCERISKEGGGRTDASRLTVLIVEDDRVQQKLLTWYLTEAGHHIITAANGREAMRLVLDANPQVVITDWLIPEMTGVEFCRALRQTTLGQQIYIIMLTSFENEDHLVEGLEAGADDFLVKPLRPKTLLARLRASQRVIQLQQEVNRDKEELRKYGAELAVANRRLQQAALTDVLTGLPNRAYAMNRLEQEWFAAQRDGQALACMVLDIDHFKKVNDTYGHDAGDVVLRETSAVLRDNLRLSDVVCRFGGEEFVTICPGTDLQAALICAERLRSRVEKNIVSTGAFRGHITLSIGVAGANSAMERYGDLLKAADKAVYAAKQSGRNRVCGATA